MFIVSASIQNIKLLYERNYFAPKGACLETANAEAINITHLTVRDSNAR